MFSVSNTSRTLLRPCSHSTRRIANSASVGRRRGGLGSLLRGMTEFLLKPWYLVHQNLSSCPIFPIPTEILCASPPLLPCRREPPLSGPSLPSSAAPCCRCGRRHTHRR